jgi:hypothetical protein
MRRLLITAYCIIGLLLGITFLVTYHAVSPRTPINELERRQLENVLEALRAGATVYPEAEPMMAEALAQQAPIFSTLFKRLGKLQDIYLQRTQQGENVYELWFENGRAICGVSESRAGKIAGMRIELQQHR